MSTLRLGIIGGGLMGREMASAVSRWCALEDVGVGCEITAVCDLAPAARDWFGRLPSLRLATADHRELLASTDVDAVYVAVPHQLHEKIYLDVLEAGKDLLAEKPFGIDLAAARNIATRAKELGRFVRCSSEFPFLPGAQRVFQFAREGKLGRPLEVRSAFLHSSDLDPSKPVNWKRQTSTCGAIGVMGDLGMHVMHLPLRLGWKPKRVYAQLQKVYTQRPDGKGGTAPADTWDNAMLHTDIAVLGEQIPMRLEMKRLSPGDTNSWIFEVFGTDGGARFSTKDPKALWIFRRGKEQSWERIDLGFSMPFKTVTGGIFEPGFPDILQQMLASFAAERAGTLGTRFGCVTPDEAVGAHEVFAAALQSEREGRAVPLAET
jgi:predicted dehydrogenase